MNFFLIQFSKTSANWLYSWNLPHFLLQYSYFLIVLLIFEFQVSFTVVAYFTAAFWCKIKRVFLKNPGFCQAQTWKLKLKLTILRWLCVGPRGEWEFHADARRRYVLEMKKEARQLTHSLTHLCTFGRGAREFVHIFCFSEAPLNMFHS